MLGKERRSVTPEGVSRGRTGRDRLGEPSKGTEKCRVLGGTEEVLAFPENSTRAGHWASVTPRRVAPFKSLP